MRADDKMGETEQRPEDNGHQIPVLGLHVAERPRRATAADRDGGAHKAVSNCCPVLSGEARRGFVSTDGLDPSFIFVKFDDFPAWLTIRETGA